MSTTEKVAGEEPKRKRDLGKLISTELPEVVLRAFERKGKEQAQLVKRFRAARDEKTRQACANHLAFNFDREMWDLYYRKVEGVVLKDCLWIRIVDFETERGISPDVARRAAKRGLIPDARLLPDGTWVIPSNCEFEPREYRKKEVTPQAKDARSPARRKTKRKSG
jgi:hypothetical protein